MAKEIVIWCEIHIRKDERAPGTEQEVSINGKTFILDVCTECYKEQLQPIVDLLDEFGEPQSRSAKKVKAPKAAKATGATQRQSVKYTPNEDGVFECRLCDREFNTAQGIGRHMTSHVG